MSPKAKTTLTKKDASPALKAVGTVVDRALGAMIDALSPDERSATHLLTAQHRAVRALFERIEVASQPSAKRALFEEVARALVAHDAIEREIFYPACEKAMGMTDLLGEALVEHGVIEFCVYEADRAKDADFGFKCTVLREMVEHHVKEEEAEFLPHAEKALGKTRLEELGTEMSARFEQAQGEDFREALVSNLKQVLAGTTRPSAPRRTPKTPKKRAAKPGKRRRAA